MYIVLFSGRWEERGVGDNLGEKPMRFWSSLSIIFVVDANEVVLEDWSDMVLLVASTEELDWRYYTYFKSEV